MDHHLTLLRKSFGSTALDFEFGPKDKQYKALTRFHTEQMRQLYDLQQKPDQENKPSETYLHSFRVANDVFIFAIYVGLSNQIARNLRWCVALHDIGKLDVPPEILNKRGRLSDDEYEEMKMHTRYGANRIKNSGIDHPLIHLSAELAMYHHERIDGNGYYGIQGKDMAARLRLVQLCDIFDAVSAPRNYRTDKEQLSIYETMKNMLDPNGFLYDVVDIGFARPFCLLKLNLLEADLSKAHHKRLERYLLSEEHYPDEAYAAPADYLREID